MRTDHHPWGTRPWAETPVLYLDTETTGFRNSDRIVEMAMVLAVGTEVVREFHSIVDPEIHIPEDAAAIHGISNAKVAGAPCWEEVEDEIFSMMTEDAVWVAHGLGFDLRMIRNTSGRALPSGVPTLCTADYARYRDPALKQLRKHKLSDLANYFDVAYDPGELHSALYDTRLLAQLAPSMLASKTVGAVMTKYSHDW